MDGVSRFPARTTPCTARTHPLVGRSAAGISSGCAADKDGDGHGKPAPFAPGSKKGQHGTDLEPLPGVVTKWEAGSAQEVAWAILANHGGGYQCE